ncbi:helix-turn-helix domain-containing protein [Serratia bockelmannii]|uniref:helix-turn-helix domain-containing protein n=1 Tax=Serratia bockelmannii TaxID=2703793 RepID=UPI003FA6FCC6
MSYGEKTANNSKNRDRFFVEYGINRFGERLKQAMEAKGITSNVKMGELCSMSDTVIRNYLIGKTYPTLDRLSSIAFALDCSPIWLMSGLDQQLAPGEHKNNIGNINSDSQEATVLDMLSQAQREVLTKAILEHGVAGILAALNGMADLTNFMQFPEEQRAQMLRLFSEVKKGASEGSEPNEAESLASNNKRAG